METFFAALIFLAIVVVFTGEFFQQKLGVSSMPAMLKVRRAMIAEIPEAAAGTVVEMGSGWGGIAAAAAKAFPRRQVIGVEYSAFPFLVSRLRPPLPNLKFVRRNFFDVPLAEVSVVLCYLSNPIMAKLKEKLMRELPPGALVISSTFFIPEWEPEKTIDLGGWWKTRIFVYRKA